jgi:glycosyltransferase involved in cell wall biosynthesis
MSSGLLASRQPGTDRQLFQPAATQPTVCQVLHGLRTGGAEVLAARLARQLQHSYRFVFVCLDELGNLGEELRAEGFTVATLGRRAGIDLRCALLLARFVRRQRVDLLHPHQYTPFFYSLMARALSRRVPVLFTEHGRHFPDYRRVKRVIANRLLLGPRDRVVGVGQAVREAVIRNEGIPADRVEYVYNGIDLRPYAHRAERHEVRRELGVGLQDLVMIQVARLDYLKDHATAIRMLQRVASRRPDARLVLVGEGPERAKIEQEVYQRGVSERVHFLGLRADVPRLLRAADVLVLTSISEGIPLTLIEAGAAGLPVVSTDVGGVGEVIERDVTGLLAPARNDASLAQHILRLADDSALRRRMGEAGLRRVRECFSEEQMHAGYLRLYQEMLA